MIRKVFKGSKSHVLLLAALLLSGFVLIGCGSGGGGSDSYDEPEGQSTTPIVGQSDNVLIDAATLKTWVDAGKVNATSYENVIILQQKSYDAGHIPGAQEWALSGIDRIDGPVLSGNMVLDGSTMDEMMQERGIVKGSTIVFMGNNSERIYFFFRYWGFPKDQLKILNGGTAAWTNAGYELTTVTPVVSSSDFSVSELADSFDPDVRASLSEMIIGVEQQTIVPFATYAHTTNLTTPKVTETLDGTDGGPAGSGGYVLFQGFMDGQAVDPDLQHDYVYESGTYNLAFAGLFNADGTYKSKADMETYLQSIGIDGTKPIVTFCRAGNLAATGFAPMDAVLDWDIMLYDGSWSQWASLTKDSTTIPTGKLWALPNTSPDYTAWATNELTSDGVGGDPFYLVDYIGNITWSGSSVAFVPADHIQQPLFYEAPASPYDDGANNIEDEDADYEPASAPTAAGSVSGSGGC
ncbi:MAG: selenite/tellurite reduction operon rhodanese-like protein ExtH [Desulfuromonas sp.]|nr:selenite/tellurite reduction operon rhodanese-like protein ExtH [Desulfuromonas sp.]